jgi:hypothetical protein
MKGKCKKLKRAEYDLLLTLLMFNMVNLSRERYL